MNEREPHPSGQEEVEEIENEFSVEEEVENLAEEAANEPGGQAARKLVAIGADIIELVGPAVFQSHPSPELWAEVQPFLSSVVRAAKDWAGGANNSQQLAELQGEPFKAFDERCQELSEFEISAGKLVGNLLTAALQLDPEWLDTNVEPNKQHETASIGAFGIVEMFESEDAAAGLIASVEQEQVTDPDAAIAAIVQKHTS